MATTSPSTDAKRYGDWSVHSGAARASTGAAVPSGTGVGGAASASEITR